MGTLTALLDFLEAHHGVNDKDILVELVIEKFGLSRSRSIYHCDEFAIRFSSASGQAAGNNNTITSLSNLSKVDHIPFLSCLVTPTRNIVRLANSTLIRKLSHSKQELRVDKVRGSFNLSNIARYHEGIANEPANFQRLFDVHREIGFDGNLARLVESTANIAPRGQKFAVLPEMMRMILDAPLRAAEFAASAYAETLKRELDERVEQVKYAIFNASKNKNVKQRGQTIEYLIAGEDDALRQQLIMALRDGTRIPAVKTQNTLGDYRRVFDEYRTESDVKSKIMVLSSNPKAYNLDKILEFLATEKVFSSSTLSVWTRIEA